ncbi:MAG: hypothetical protein AB7T49_09995 [Oligoflexales bacterium]
MLAFLKKLFSAPTSKENLPGGTEGSDRKNRRKTPRQNILDDGFVWLTGVQISPIFVKDLSYGGLSLKSDWDSMKHILKDKRTLKVNLHMFHKHHKCEIMPIYENNGAVGCSFVHSSPETLLFLRNFLEFLRVGSTMEKVPPHLMERKSIDENLEIYSSESGTEIIMRRTENNNLAFFNLSFTDTNIFSQVIFDNGNFKYRRFNDDDNALLTLEHALFILLGFQEHRKLKLIEPVVDLLQKELTDRTGAPLKAV